MKLVILKFGSMEQVYSDPSRLPHILRLLPLHPSSGPALAKTPSTYLFTRDAEDLVGPRPSHNEMPRTPIQNSVHYGSKLPEMRKRSSRYVPTLCAALPLHVTNNKIAALSIIRFSIQVLAPCRFSLDECNLRAS